MKTLSVIIPDTDSLLMRKIVAALKGQTVSLAPVEVLVVGTDAPGQVEPDDLVRFLPAPPPANASVKRNLGMQAAQGDIFLFLDDDCIPAPDWIERHLWRHGQGEQVVQGAVTFDTRSYLQLVDNVSAFHDLLPFTREGPRPYACTANLSVRRTVVERVGAMDPSLDRAEDLEWSQRFRAAGYTLYFEPQAVIHHDPPRRTLAMVWRHWTVRSYARCTLAVLLRHSESLQTPRLARYRSLYLWGAPVVAAWATARTFRHPQALARYSHTLPLVYLTKLAWCWSAFRNFPDETRKAV